MRRSLQIALGLAFVLCSATAQAQDWRGQLKMVDSDLRAARYSHARKWSIKMINSMSDNLGTGPDAMYTLATTVAYRALAEAGLQKFDEADWYWHVALSLHPKLADNNWKPYGAAGEWATNHKDDLKLMEDSPKAVPINKTEPKCPLSAVVGGYYQPVRIGAIIDDKGNARCPSLVAPTQAPTLAYAAFEALKQWQFRATAPARYEVTVDFQAPAP